MDEPTNDSKESVIQDWVLQTLDRFAETIEHVEQYATLTDSVDPELFAVNLQINGRPYDIDAFNRRMRWHLDLYRAQIAFDREVLRIWIENPPDRQSQVQAAVNLFEERKKALRLREPD
jgi:hypothetical protein